ncbi:pyridoxamine 5'-phosphate oxidase family protein [Mesorhizobium sp. SB112]|uniref:pyridoxamine 5'-phosphate oxidase family protein n=1 Tax=Mesorhizobium sp. SB112 TaxID=3151853 RepID=UPI003264C50B
MDARARSFIETATLLFIASRNAAGGMDVSPRGGQPSVVRLRDDGNLLLPDYVGNRRLDTMGNVLSNPAVALILLNKQKDEYLRIRAKAEISRSEADIAMFPADENPPISVMVLTPLALESIESTAFARSGLWVDPSDRKLPLDLMDILVKDAHWQGGRGRKPVALDAAGEGNLARSGLRELYGTPSSPVQAKVYSTAGPGTQALLDKARFTIFARGDGKDGIALDLIGGVTLQPDSTANKPSFLLALPHDQFKDCTLPQSGECALLAVEPGQCETVRMNGVYRVLPPDNEAEDRLNITPEETYFHCSAAFARSRIWTDARAAAWTGQRSFSCVAKLSESPDVMSFVLAPRDNAPLGVVTPGQYVTVSLPRDESQPQRRRCYSVSSVPDGRSLRITVRRIGKGGVSDLLHDKVEPGDEVLVAAPAGGFVLDSAPSRAVVLVSAGVGITPLLAMLEELGREAADRDVWFIHAARDADHHLFREEALQIAKQSEAAIRLFTAYSRSRHDEACDHCGRLDAPTIATLVQLSSADFYICGPDDFMSSLRQGLVALGASPESIRTEAFKPLAGVFPGTISGVGLATCQVKFARSGKTATWKPESRSLLDLALANAVDVQYSCRNGDCQSCVQRVVSGVVDYPAGDEPFLTYGQVLLCQAIPRGNLVLDC